mgnify:CR=1 FL=1
MATYETVLSLFARDNTARAFQSLNRRLKKLGASIAGAATRFAKIGTAAALAAGAATSAFVGMRMAAIDSLAKTADKIGATTQALAGLQHAGELTGVSTQTMSMALQRMQRRLAEAAQGMGVARGALKELNLDAKQLLSLPLDQQMEVVADAMAGVETQADRVRLAMQFFDSEGVALVNTLGQGSDALRAMMNEADALGISLSRVDAKKIEDANDAAARTKGVFVGIGNQLAVSFAPALESVSNWITHLALNSKGFGDIGQDAFNFVADSIDNSIRAIRSFNVGIVSARVSLLEFIEGFNAFRDRSLIVDWTNDAIEGLNKMRRGFAQWWAETSPRRRAPLVVPIEPVAVPFSTSKEFKDGIAYAKEQAKKALDEALAVSAQGASSSVRKFIADFTALPKPGAVKPGALPPEVDNAISTIENEVERKAETLRGNVSDALIDGVVDSKAAMLNSFSNILKSMARDLVRSKIMSLLKTAFGGGQEGGFFSRIFGKKAAGGNVMANRPYMVGERGPELMVPSSSGRIIPNSKLRGAGVTINQTNTYNVESGFDEAALREMQMLQAAQTKAEIMQSLRSHGVGMRG